MSTTFSKTRIHPSYRVSCGFETSFWVRDGNALFSAVSQFLQATWVTLINYFFKKSPENDDWWGEVWRSRWPKDMPNNALTKKL
jgi:hypothetical protein